MVAGWVLVAPKGCCGFRGHNIGTPHPPALGSALAAKASSQQQRRFQPFARDFRCDDHRWPGPGLLLPLSLWQAALRQGLGGAERHDEGPMTWQDRHNTPCKVLESAEGMILELRAARIWGI